MDEAKERVLAIYKEAAREAFEALGNAEETEYNREVFAEKYGRRQAYGRVLKEVFGVSKEELQSILDNVNV